MVIATNVFVILRQKRNNATGRTLTGVSAPAGPQFGPWGSVGCDGDDTEKIVVKQAIFLSEVRKIVILENNAPSQVKH